MLAVPFVRSIHLASNPDGDKSQILAITQQTLASYVSAPQTSSVSQTQAEPAVAEMVQ
jgi:hypothetical protein